MPDYSRGKIYKITAGELTYIGSTCEPTLARRLASHVGEYKQWKAGKMNFTSSFPLIETGQYEITLIELCPCGSRDELNARERFHIESTVCVNKNIAGRTPTEYYKVNADRISARHKAYQEANADTLREKQKIYRDARRDEINARQREAYREKKSAVV